MQIQKTQTREKPLEEKIKSIPIDQQNYIKGLIDGALMGAKNSTIGGGASC